MKTFSTFLIMLKTQEVLKMKKQFTYFLKSSIAILLILVCSYPLLAQPQGAWVEKQLPNGRSTNFSYAVGENCLIYVGQNDSLVCAYDLKSGQWHEYNQPTNTPWKYAAAGTDVAIVATDSILTAYSAISQSFSTTNYEGTLLGQGGSSYLFFIGCMEKVAYFVTDKYFYIFDTHNSQWQTHPIIGIAEINLDVKYEGLGYIFIVLTDDAHNEKLIAYSTITKHFTELNFTYDIYPLPFERLDYGFVVWDHTKGSFGCYSAIHDTWTEHYESEEFFNVGIVSDADHLTPRTVYMFRVHKVLESSYVNTTFYIYNTLYPEPCVVSRSSNEDYEIHDYSVGAQTAVISFMNRSNNKLDILAYKSETHSATPFIVSSLYVKQNITWHSCGGNIYLGNDFDHVIAGYPDKGKMVYAPMPAGYAQNINWDRRIEVRKDWGILLIDDKVAGLAHIYKYNIASEDSITYFNTEWGNHSYIKIGDNNKVAGLLSDRSDGYKLFLYSPVYNKWTEKTSGPNRPSLYIKGDFIYYQEPNSNQLTVFNGATNQAFDLPFGQTGFTAMDYTWAGENFLIAYTTDNKYVSYSAITGTSNEIASNRYGTFRGDQSICVVSTGYGALTYNALSDAFLNLNLSAEQGGTYFLNVGGKIALITTANGYLFAFDPYKDISTSIENIVQGTDLSSGFQLEQNYPNPFHTVTSIKYFLSVPEYVRIDIYNTQGIKVRTLINKKMVAGQHVIDFDSGELSGGMYLYKLTAGSFQQCKKMLLLK